MNYLYLGKIVNTHGIKGEIRIISDFERKDLVFIPNFKIYIGNNKEENIINTYRHHKNFEMITLKGINDINDVLKYKGLHVYINRDDLKLDTFLINDLINYKIVNNNNFYGIIKEIRSNNHDYLLYIEYNNKYYYIPYVNEFITNINHEKKEIEVERVEELL